MAQRKNDSPHQRRRILLAMELSSETAERRFGIAEYARKVGWILESRLVAFAAIGQAREYLDSIRFDGIISRMRGNEYGFRDLVATTKVPVVDLWQAFPEIKVPRVLLDYKEGGRLAGEHLLSLGLKHILFYSHTVDSSAATLRRDGVREAAEARGARFDEIWWDIHQRLPRGQNRIGYLASQLKKFTPPFGVAAAIDFVASDVFDAADQLGLRVPDDIAVIGSDNDPMIAELGAVPLSSVDIARQTSGYEAAALLDRMIDGHKPPARPILIAPAGVIVRRSTEMTAVADPDVKTAARFIRDHFQEPITVADVVAKTFLSRRRLQDRFVAALGHGMKEEITRQRLLLCQHLLTQTKQKVASIATKAGFGSVHRMDKVFKAQFGLTPFAYRRAYSPSPIETPR